MKIPSNHRASNLPSAPLCSSYGAERYYEDPTIDGDEIALPPKEGKCTTVSGLIVDLGAGKPMWKILTGKLEQDFYQAHSLAEYMLNIAY